LTQLAGMDFGKMVRVEPLMIDDRDPLESELEAFLQAVRTCTTPPVSAEDGVRAVRLASQIVRAVQTHRWDGANSERVGLQADIFGRAVERSAVQA
jgi:predicted dehydrogenase